MVFFLDIRIEGEDYDRPDLTLPGQQGTLLTDVVAVGEQLVTQYSSLAKDLDVDSRPIFYRLITTRTLTWSPWTWLWLADSVFKSQ